MRVVRRAARAACAPVRARAHVCHMHRLCDAQTVFIINQARYHVQRRCFLKTDEVWPVLLMMAATLEELLANRNSWSQDIKLEFSQGQKDIFRGSVPVEASSKEIFTLKLGAETPFSLFAFELRSVFEEARSRVAASGGADGRGRRLQNKTSLNLSIVWVLCADITRHRIQNKRRTTRGPQGILLGVAVKQDAQ